MGSGSLGEFATGVSYNSRMNLDCISGSTVECHSNELLVHHIPTINIHCGANNIACSRGN